MTAIRVGIFAPVGQFAAPAGQRDALLSHIAESAVDHICVNDHVSFFVGAGADALIDAAALLTRYPDLPCYVALYLLPLRHPVLVARQLASIAELAPGRLMFGVGIGGEDPHEFEICGVDPRTRGRRMDESLEILRSLSDGKPVSFDGEFFSIRDAQIVPAPSSPIPITIGGRSDAAVRRAGRFGDGWLGIWVSSGRFGSVVDQVAEHARLVGRDPSGLRTRSTSGVASAPPARPPARHSPRGCRPSTRCRSSPSSAIRLTGHPKTSPNSFTRTSTPAARCST